MEKENSKSLSSFVFLPLLSLIFIRPFISGLAYPIFEFYYEILVIFLAIISLAICRGGFKTLPYGYKAILIILSAYIISTITSVNLHNSLKETLKFISYISVFFIIYQTNDDQKNTLIKTLITAAVIISLYSIYQYFFGYQHTIDYLKRTGNDTLLNSSYARDVLIAKRAIGTFPSPNIFGSYLIMIFFLSLSILFERAKRVENPLTSLRAGFSIRPLRGLTRRIFILTIILIALILTKSLGAWLSLIICLIILFFISYNNLHNKKIILIASGLCIAFVLLFIILNRWERLMNLENPQNSITQRINYWRTAISIIKDHPILGVGPGNFQEVFLKYKVGLSTNTRYAHNIFLQMWAEAGILGFAGIVFLITSIFKSYKPQNKYIFLACIAFLLHNFIDNSYFIPETGVIWWVLLAFSNKIFHIY